MIRTQLEGFKSARKTSFIFRNSAIAMRHRRGLRKGIAMQTYAGRGDSGIAAYEIGPGWIKIRFTDGGTYLYDDSAPGAVHVREMQRLAQSGEGLNTYINKHVRENYAARLA
jgi:hypothetical protein